LARHIGNALAASIEVVRPNKKRHRVRAPLDGAHLSAKRNGTSRRGKPWRLLRVLHVLLAQGRIDKFPWLSDIAHQVGTCRRKASFITAPYRQLPVTESSVRLSPDPRRSIMITFHGPRCPKRKATTVLGRITPCPSGFDIRTFECPACDHVHQRVVELVDPMKSGEVAGWLRGELRAPT
jgi:hypothetical protein